MPRKARPIEERFWKRVDKTSSARGCWLWTGARSSNGYGQINKGGKHGTHISVHKLSWQLTRGPIPAGLNVCHACDDPKCVNPDHLFLGTQKQNVEDCCRKGRRALGEQHGMSRHTAADVKEIFSLYRSGQTQVEIARRFGVLQGAISNILAGKTWRHLDAGRPQ